MPSSTRRLFFALWPDEEIRREIVARRERLGRVSRRQVPAHNLHLTLVFLGNLANERVTGLETLAEAVQAPPSSLTLDRFGWFPRPRVLWLGGEAPAALARLQAQLHRRVLESGIRLDDRPFRPHVTLFRQVIRRPELPGPEPLIWPVRDFVLVESLPGRPYRVVGRWSL